MTLYIMIHKKQGRWKTKLLNLFKWSRTEVVREMIQPLHITVATSYQDATVNKVYNDCTEPENIEGLAFQFLLLCVS